MIVQNKIPQLQIVGELSDVTLHENGEKLVVLNEVRPDTLVVFSKAYKEGKQGGIKDVYVRESVRDLLIKASENLPKGYKLIVWETYTPRALQEYLRNTKLDDISGIAHMTGGGIDVSLADSSGNLLNMGTDLSDQAPQNKNTRYFEELNELSEEDALCREHRRILFHAMSEAGFTNNPLAWFHWDYGNLWWAKLKNTHAFYGPIDQ